jgi:hypothetical protein
MFLKKYKKGFNIFLYIYSITFKFFIFVSCFKELIIEDTLLNPCIKIIKIKLININYLFF